MKKDLGLKKMIVMSMKYKKKFVPFYAACIEERRSHQSAGN